MLLICPLKKEEFHGRPHPYKKSRFKSCTNNNNNNDRLYFHRDRVKKTIFSGDKITITINTFY